MAVRPSNKKIHRVHSRKVENDTVASALRLIIEGDLSPGGRVTERWLVDSLSTTHSDAREVLHQLDKLGVLSLSPRRGATLVSQGDTDPTDVRPVWLALLELAGQRAQERSRVDDTVEPLGVVADGRWEKFLCLRWSIARICRDAALPRLEHTLQRLALRSFAAHQGAAAIDLNAMLRLADKMSARDFADLKAAIEATFVETTRRFPARREAAQLPEVAPTPIIPAGRHIEKLQSFLQRIATRIAFGPVTAPSASDQVAATILQRVQFGKLRPGDAVRELPIAVEFNTSRGPVRDALRRLDRRGIISIEGRKGAFVRKLDADDIVGLFSIRAALSGVQMAEAAAAPGRPQWVDDELLAGADLLRLLAHDRESPLENYIVARRALALVTLAAGGNIVVGRLAAELEGEVSMLWATVISKRRQEESADTWRVIVNAIIAGDVERARAEGQRIVLDAAEEALKSSF